MAQIQFKEFLEILKTYKNWPKIGDNRPEETIYYVIHGLNSKLRRYAKKLLPKGLGGGELTTSGWSGIDILEKPLDLSLPHIPFFPR